MDKNAFLGFKTIVILIILMVFLITFTYIFFLGGDSLMKKIADAAESLADNIFGRIRETSPVASVEDSVSSEIKGSFNDLKSTLEQKKEGPCITEHNPFPSNFKDGKIKISKVGEDSFVELLNEQGQTVDQYKVKDLLPCAVIGNGAINFEDNWIKKQCAGDSKNCPKDYKEVSTIEITDDDNIRIDGKKYDLEDRNMLYIRDGYICFIPTKFGLTLNPMNFGCDSSGGVLDQACMDDIKLGNC